MLKELKSSNIDSLYLYTILTASFTPSNGVKIKILFSNVHPETKWLHRYLLWQFLQFVQQFWQFVQPFQQFIQFEWRFQQFLKFVQQVLQFWQLLRQFS